jgi:WD40 repeat protein
MTSQQTTSTTNDYEQLIQILSSLGIDPSTASKYTENLHKYGITSITKLQSVTITDLQQAGITAKLHTKLILQNNGVLVDTETPQISNNTVIITTTTMTKKVAPKVGLIEMKPTKRMNTLMTHTRYLNYMRFFHNKETNRDGLITAGSNGNCKIWNIHEDDYNDMFQGEVRFSTEENHNASTTCFAISEYGELFAMGNTRGDIEVYNISDWSVYCTIYNNRIGTWALEFISNITSSRSSSVKDNKTDLRLVVAGENGTLYLFQCAKNNLIPIQNISLQNNCALLAMAIYPIHEQQLSSNDNIDSLMIAISTGIPSATIHILNQDFQTICEIRVHSKYVRIVHWIDATHILSGGGDQYLSVSDITTQKEIKRIDMPYDTWSFDISYDRTAIAIGCSSGEVVILSYPELIQTLQIPCGNPSQHVYGLAFSLNEPIMATGDSDGNIRLFYFD